MIPCTSKVHQAFNACPSFGVYDYGIFSGMPPLGVTYTNGRESVYIENKESKDLYFKKLDEVLEKKDGG